MPVHSVIFCTRSRVSVSVSDSTGLGLGRLGLGLGKVGLGLGLGLGWTGLGLGLGLGLGHWRSRYITGMWASRKAIFPEPPTGVNISFHSSQYIAVADPGGGQGVRTPPFGPRCRLFNIGPKVGPPLGPPPPFLLVYLRPTPVADPGCVCDAPPPWNVDDVTRAMSKGGVLVNVQEWGCFSIFLRADDVTRTMSKGGGVLVKNLVSAPGPPPPFKNPASAPVLVFLVISGKS